MKPTSAWSLVIQHLNLALTVSVILGKLCNFSESRSPHQLDVSNTNTNICLKGWPGELMTCKKAVRTASTKILSDHCRKAFLTYY